MQPPLRQRGFTLLEVLITVVIVALGLLGLGALHVRAMRDTGLAYYRSEADVLVYDMADRIRTNLALIQATATPYSLTLAQFDALTAAPANLCINIASRCTLDQMRAADLWQWHEAVRTRLPGGHSEIVVSCVDPSTGAAVGTCTTATVRSWTITVHWDELRNGNTGTNCPAGSGDLACRQLRIRP